jgi:hypothetical protein
MIWHKKPTVNNIEPIPFPSHHHCAIPSTLLKSALPTNLQVGLLFVSSILLTCPIDCSLLDCNFLTREQKIVRLLIL